MTRPVVLVVEDEAVMRRVLCVSLRSQGYDVLEAACGSDAFSHLYERPPNVILLDLGLPDMDGVDVTTAIRRDHDVPIIVVSARGEEPDQIQALDAGANDYVTKPFREGELLARVRAALRPVTRDRLELAVGPLRLDVLQRRVYVRGEPVALTPKEFELLHLLMREAGRVVTHRRLLCEVWGPEHVDEVQYLRVYMKELRRKLEVDPKVPRLLLTAPGIGYRLESEA